MQQRAFWRVAHQFHGFDILNIDAITKHYPSVRAEVLKHDVIQWLNMDDAQREEHVAARAAVQVAHTLPGGVSCATQVRVVRMVVVCMGCMHVGLRACWVHACIS